MNFRPEPVRRPREQIEEQLRQAIVSSAFKGGDRLPSEAQLAKEFRVSRSTVREALRAVAAEGLISKQSGATGGSFVETVNHESLGSQLSDSMGTILKLGTVTGAEVAAVREMLAVPAARLAAENRSEADVATMREVLQRAAGVAVDSEEAIELDIAFHKLVAAASKNRLLIAFLSALLAVSLRRHYVKSGPDVAAETRGRHEALFEAIAARDGDAAAAAMAAQLAYFHGITRGEPSVAEGETPGANGR